MGGTTDQSVRPIWDERFSVSACGTIEPPFVPERIDMNPTIAVLADETRRDQILPRDQFVPQVPDLALPARQILEEQRQSLRSVDEAPTFVP